MYSWENGIKQGERHTCILKWPDLHPVVKNWLVDNRNSNISAYKNSHAWKEKMGGYTWHQWLAEQLLGVRRVQRVKNCEMGGKCEAVKKNCGIRNALDSAKYKTPLDEIRSSERMLQTVVIKILQDSIITGSFILYCHSVEQLYLIYDFQNLRASYGPVLSHSSG